MQVASNNKTTIQYKYIDKDSRVYIGVIPKKESRSLFGESKRMTSSFYSVPWGITTLEQPSKTRVKKVARVSSINDQRHHIIATECPRVFTESVMVSSKSTDVKVVDISLPELKHMASVMYMPLAVICNSYCDIATHDRVLEVYYYKPPGLLTQ